ncbi:MAG: phosphoenolpyruvate---glycerone phosphotransferase subunit DhaL, partial [Nocardioidaceae bacterium]|nr:phosphoenolpyruvate---glycerone phosphotransferase subunit DhaL [Nocardioidaceae bacterium]
MPDDVTAAAFDAWVRRFAALVAEERDHLTELDSAIGDADHGTNLDRGLKAAVAALDELGPAGAGPVLTKVGMTLVSTVGGASGPLYGTLFLRMGGTLGDTPEVAPAEVSAAFRAGLEGVVARGKAQAEDKTMYDAFAPAVDALEAGVGDGLGLADALAQARAAAEKGR